MSIKNICCIGGGYVGGPTMAVIADKCHEIQVNVVDKNAERIKSWNELDINKLPVYEKGLAEIVKRRRNINLHFSTNLKSNIEKADMIFISVNTPIKEKGIGAGKASDLKWIEASAREISEYAIGHTIIVEKSTLPVRTAQTIKEILLSNKRNEFNSTKEDKTFSILSNPEFLAEGTAINDLVNPDRVLIGGEDEKSIKALSNIYLNWVKEEKIITTNLWSSELSKLIANAFLAQRISSINSITALCELTGADTKEVVNAIGMDSRIGNKFLSPGPGFGGSCFKKDILNLVYISTFYGLHETANYWEQILKINDWQQSRITKIILTKLFNNISGKKISILGFSFKAGTNDTRESPSIKICKELIDEGGILNIFDPIVSTKQIEKELNIEEIRDFESPQIKGGWKSSNSILESVKGADAILILTEWIEFKNLDFQKISKLMRSPSWIFDTRLILDSKDASKYGFNVWHIGKG